jgi:glycerophosphoryl diester phosphodiesterase
MTKPCRKANCSLSSKELRNNGTSQTNNTQRDHNKAHANNIRCNFFYSDDPEEAVKLLEMGVDTLLTNDYLAIANATRHLVKAAH